jgi:hypothetical protein
VCQCTNTLNYSIKITTCQVPEFWVIVRWLVEIEFKLG